MAELSKEGRGQTKSRLLKIECPACGVILRGSASALRASGLPWCGCGERFTIPALASLKRINPDAHAALLTSLHEPARREQPDA